MLTASNTKIIFHAIHDFSELSSRNLIYQNKEKTGIMHSISILHSCDAVATALNPFWSIVDSNRIYKFYDLTKNARQMNYAQEHKM